jgi:hypothetical protein
MGFSRSRELDETREKWYLEEAHYRGEAMAKKAFCVLLGVFLCTLASAARADGDLAACIQACTLEGKIVCGSATDILHACSDVPICVGLSEEQAKAANGFCDACRAEEHRCGEQPADSPPQEAAPKPQPDTKPAATRKPTPEEFCRRKGGVMVDGVCYTLSTVVKELNKLKDADKRDLDAIRKRVEGFVNADVSEEYKTWARGVLNESMKWVVEKFDNVDYRLEQQATQDHAQSQRLDLHDRQIAELQQGQTKSAELGSPLGFEIALGGNVHAVRPFPDEMSYDLGVEFVLLPKVTTDISVMFAAGIGYSGEADDGSLATLRIGAGLRGRIAWRFFLTGAFVTEQTFLDFDEKRLDFYGVSLEPSVSITEGPTAVISVPIAIGASRALLPSGEYGAYFDATFGLRAGFAYE